MARTGAESARTEAAATYLEAAETQRRGAAAHGRARRVLMARAAMYRALLLERAAAAELADPEPR